MYFTMTATTDNEQINQKKYLLPEKSQRVQVNGEECGAELCLEKTEDGSFVGLGHISADFLKKKEFSDQRFRKKRLMSEPAGRLQKEAVYRNR